MSRSLWADVAILAIATHAVTANVNLRSTDCSLNGVNVGGICHCDVPWTGKQCGRLDFEPSPIGHLPAYGFKPNVTSWGGNAILGDDGFYHLFVSEMAGGGGLSTWTHKSQIAHAVAKDPMDVFVRRNTTLPPWSHNAAPVRAPKVHTHCPMCWYLFHIGSGEPKGAQSDATTSGFAHRSTSPDGPWTPLPAPFGCNNPAPAFARNGTLFVVCDSHDIYRADGDPVDKTVWAHVATVDETAWRHPRPFLNVEDAFLWQDQNSNWHLLAHRYDYRDGYPVNSNVTQPVLVAGHAFSEDLRVWHLSPEPPFDSLTNFADGTVQHFATMERPKLIFGPDGAPTHSVHGVSPIWDQYGAPCNVCDKRPGVAHSCVVCKTSVGYDWTYTLVRQLRAAAAQPGNGAAVLL